MRHLLPLLLLLTTPLACASTSQDFWQLQTSVYTSHFRPDSEHNNNQDLIGMERNYASGRLWGGATFRNSFSQRSEYLYFGQRFDSDRYPLYFKVSGGLIHGYRGDYRNKIPLNHFGIAPAIIPAIGAHYRNVNTELILLGNAALMVNVGWRLPD